MNEIQRLIHEMCPNGVPMVALGEVLNFEQPTKYIVKSTEYNNCFPIPVLTAGQSFILGYTNETEGIYEASKEKPTIIFDDFTTSSHWVDFRFKVKSSAMKMLRPNNDDNCFRYIFYAMRCIDYVPIEHARHWIGKYSLFQIPLPPLTIQQRIVEILDKFTSLVSSLDSEIALRQKQYEYYRNKLLSFEEGVKIISLGEVCEIKNGKDYKHLSSGNIPVWGTGGIMTYVDKYAYNGPSVLLPRKGSIDKVYYSEGPIWTVDTLFYTIINESIIDPKFLFNAISIQDLRALDTSKGNRPSLTQTVLNKIQIPLPPLSVQLSIVRTLDTFESLLTNLKKERELRQKQYEYYREKLLTFA